MNTFRVLSTIWHTKDKKYYEPGEIVDLSHLDGIGLNVLLLAKAIEPAVSEEKKKKKASGLVEEGE